MKQAAIRKAVRQAISDTYDTDGYLHSGKAADAAIAAHLKALEAAGPWTPIGTNPQPGKICIFAWHHPGLGYEGTDITVIHLLIWPEDGNWYGSPPTHWMPFEHPKSETPR